jgi:hypothetical protein
MNIPDLTGFYRAAYWTEYNSAAVPEVKKGRPNVADGNLGSVVYTDYGKVSKRLFLMNKKTKFSHHRTTTNGIVVAKHPHATHQILLKSGLVLIYEPLKAFTCLVELLILVEPKATSE